MTNLPIVKIETKEDQINLAAHLASEGFSITWINSRLGLAQDYADDGQLTAYLVEYCCEMEADEFIDVAYDRWMMYCRERKMARKITEAELAGKPIPAPLPYEPIKLEMLKPEIPSRKA